MTASSATARCQNMTVPTMSPMSLVATIVCLSLLFVMEGGSQEPGWCEIAQQAVSETASELGPFTAAAGSITFASDVVDDPQVECRWATPIGHGGHTPPRASDIVYFFHQPGNLSFEDDPLFCGLVRNSGFTVMGVCFPRSSDTSLFGTMARHYASSRSGAFLTIRRAIETIRERLRIPAKPVFLYGYSAGGIGVQRFAEEYPEICGGVVTYGGHSFIQNRKATCPFLIVNNWGDADSSGDGLECYYRIIGAPVVRLVLPPVWDAVERYGVDASHYQNRPLIDRLAMRFVEAISDLRRGNAQGETPAMVSWPYPVPGGDGHIRFPSARFAMEWSLLPSTPTVCDSPVGGQALIADPGPAVKPLGTLLLVERADAGETWSNDVRLLTDVRYCSHRGLVAIAPSMDTTSICTRCQSWINDASLARQPVAIVACTSDQEVLSRLPDLSGVRIIALICCANKVEETAAVIRRVVVAGRYLVAVAPADTATALRRVVGQLTVEEASRCTVIVSRHDDLRSPFQEHQQTLRVALAPIMEVFRQGNASTPPPVP